MIAKGEHQDNEGIYFVCLSCVGECIPKGKSETATLQDSRKIIFPLEFHLKYLVENKRKYGLQELSNIRGIRHPHG